MRKQISFFLLVALSLVGMAARAGQLHPDTLLFRYYEKAADFIAERELDSARCYFDKAFAVKGVKHSPVYPVLLNEQGTLYIYAGENEKAMAAKKEAMACLPNVEDLETHISVYNDVGILYRRCNMNDSALHYYNKALDVAVRYGDESWLASLGMNIAVLYYNMNRLAEAEQCLDQAMRYLEQADDPYVEVCTWQVRAITKADLGKMDEARASIRKAWSIASGEDGNKEWQMRCIPVLMKFYAADEQKDSADYFLQKGEELFLELPENSMSSIGFVQAKADVYFRYGRYREALKMFGDLMNGRNTGVVRSNVYGKMAVCCRELGQQEIAFAYMDSARMWTDSLAQENLTAKMAEFGVKYRTQEKELEVMRLHREQLEKDALWMGIGIVVVVMIAILLIGLLALLHKRRVAGLKMEQIKRNGELNAARRYIDGLESERKRFAKELHDGIANDLLGLQMKMSVAKDWEDLEKQVEDMRENVRRISHELMPPEFTRLDLNDILYGYLHRLAKDVKPEVAYRADPGTDYRKIPHEVAYEIYRIVQELISNILKYSEATRIEVALQETGADGFELRISDNGKGMPVTDSDNRKGIGLRTIRDRAKTIGAGIDRVSSETETAFILIWRRADS